MIAACEHIVQRLLADAPATPELLPQAALEALCELHPQYEEKARFRRMQAEEKKLIEQVEKAEAKAKQAQLRRKKKGGEEVPAAGSLEEPNSPSRQKKSQLPAVLKNQIV